MIDQIVHGYYFISDRIGVVDGARLLEGFGLAAATRDAVPAASVALGDTARRAGRIRGGGSRVGRAALARCRHPPYALERYGRLGYRIGAHVSDVNAAGSYFAMMMCLALGMAMRDRGYRRAASGVALAAASGIGLWLSESRSAMAAAAIVAGPRRDMGRDQPVSDPDASPHAGGRADRGCSGPARCAHGCSKTIRPIAVSGFREQFYATSLRMIAARPLFGIGEGQYYHSSSLFLSPQLAWTYGAENAHNSFLQIGSELGIVGLGLFMLWIGSGGRARGAIAGCASRATAGCSACASGVIVFLGTCLTGHPLLVGEVAYAFWILFGLTAGLAGSALLNNAALARVPHRGGPRAWQIPAVAAAAILVASPGERGAGKRRDRRSHRRSTDSIGGKRRKTARGSVGQAATPACSFRPMSTRVEIPVRLPTDGRSIRPMGVEVMIAGVDRGRTLIDSTLGDPQPAVAAHAAADTVQAHRLESGPRLAAGPVHRGQRGYARGRRPGRRTGACSASYRSQPRHQ